MTSLKNSEARKHTFNLEVGIIDYYKRVSQTLTDGFSNEDEKEMFLSNVIGQFEEDPVPVCKCPQTSWIIEDIIEAASLSHVTKVLEVLRVEWQSLCEDSSACHVLEKLVSVFPKFIAETLSDSSTLKLAKKAEVDETCGDHIRIIRMLLELSDSMLDNLEVNLSHIYSSHVLRMLLQVLGGLSVDDYLLKSKMSRRKKSTQLRRKEHNFKVTYYPVPLLLRKRLKKFAKQIFIQENFAVMLVDSTASHVVQTLLIVLHKNDFELCQKYIRKLIKRSRIKDVEKVDNPELVKLPPVVLDSVGSYLVETILTLASELTVRRLYEGLFQGRLFQFATHPKANFVLQRLISNCKEEEMFKEIFDEVSRHLEDILAINHFGVVVALSEGCQKLGTGQSEFRNILMSAFHCLEPAERQLKFVALLASFRTYEIFYGVSSDSSEENKEGGQVDVPILTSFNYHGTLLLQQLLQFSNTKLVVTSLLDLKPVELRNMACDPCGSHVIELFFMAETVGEKSKDALLNKLEGFYAELACHKNGSWTLEAMLKVLSIKQKTLIATELSKQEAKVRSDRLGYHIHRKLALEHFAKRRNDWVERQKTEGKKRKLFKDFLDKSENASFPKKKARQRFRPLGSGLVNSGQEDTSRDLKIQKEVEESAVVKESAENNMKKKKKKQFQKGLTNKKHNQTGVKNSVKGKRKQKKFLKNNGSVRRQVES